MEHAARSPAAEKAVGSAATADEHDVRGWLRHSTLRPFYTSSHVRAGDPRPEPRPTDDLSPYYTSAGFNRNDILRALASARGDSEITVLCIYALSYVPNNLDGRPIAAFLFSHDSQQSLAAIIASAKCGYPESLAGLLALTMNGDSTPTQLMAVEAIGHLKHYRSWIIFDEAGNAVTEDLDTDRTVAVESRLELLIQSTQDETLMSVSRRAMRMIRDKPVASTGSR